MSMNKVIILIICSFYISTCFAQFEWELKKEDKGIKVFTREVEDSNAKAIKAEAIMDGKLSSFVAVLKDVDTYPELFKNTKEAKLLEMADTFQLHYSVTAVPWPISDRYGVYSNSYSQRYDHKIVTVKVKAVEGYISEREGMVRITEANGRWTFYPVGYEKMEVTFEMHVEPGGKVPNWLANMFLIDTPLKVLKNLRERVKLPQYQNKKYEFLIEY